MRPHRVSHDDDTPVRARDAPAHQRIVSVQVAIVLEASLWCDGRVFRVGDRQYPLARLCPLVEAVLSSPGDCVHHSGWMPRPYHSDRSYALPRLVLLSLDAHPGHWSLIAVALCHTDDVDVAARLEYL